MCPVPEPGSSCPNGSFGNVSSRAFARASASNSAARVRPNRCVNEDIAWSPIVGQAGHWPARRRGWEAPENVSGRPSARCHGGKGRGTRGRQVVADGLRPEVSQTYDQTDVTEPDWMLKESPRRPADTRQGRRAFLSSADGRGRGGRVAEPQTLRLRSVAPRFTHPRASRRRKIPDER